jgi:uncharacterized protein (TIGR03435 family)
MDQKNPHPPSVTITPDRIQANGMTLQDLIKISYNLNYGAERQVSGGPPWVASARFDLDASEDGTLSEKLEHLPQSQREDQLRLMLRNLLAERFHLQLHHESRQLPIYELVTAKSGPRLTPSAPQQASAALDPDRPHMKLRFTARGVIDGNGADMEMVATALSTEPEVGGRLVVDKTGLTGKYDFTLKWAPDSGAGADAANPDSGPSLFTALQEQLGLRLETGRGPVDMVVIDHAELPTAN